MVRALVLLALLPSAACTSAPRPGPAAAAPAPQPDAGPARPRLLGWNPPCQPSRPNPPVPNDPIVSVVQPAAQRLIERAQAEPGYGGAWFENEPCYRLVLAFTDGQPRWSVIEAAEPWLRPYIGFAPARFTEAERNAAAESVRRALSEARIPWAFGDGGGTESWIIYVGSQADLERARALVPAPYLPITRFEVGIPVPVPERG